MIKIKEYKSKKVIIDGVFKNDERSIFKFKQFFSFNKINIYSDTSVFGYNPFQNNRRNPKPTKTGQLFPYESM